MDQDLTLVLLTLLLQVVKKLWAYIRENNLQDPKNRKKIKCNEALRAVFHVNSIDMFQMNKALSKHIWPLTGENGTFLNKLFSFASFCGGQWVVSCYWLLVVSLCLQYVRLLSICYLCSVSFGNLDYFALAIKFSSVSFIYLGQKSNWRVYLLNLIL